MENIYRNKRFVGLTSLFFSACQLCMSFYVAALPLIAQDIKSLPEAAQISFYLFLAAYGGSQIFYGVISDIIGRKKSITIGLIIMIFGLFLILFTNNVYSLIVSRIIQGLGAGSGAVVSRAILKDVYENHKLKRALAVWVTNLSFVSSFSPFIGGQVASFFGWKMTFGFVLVYTIIVLFIVIRRLPETNQNIYNFQKEEKKLFYAIKVLFTNKTFLTYSSILICVYSCYVLYLGIAPFIFQKALNLNTQQYSSLTLFIAVGYLVGTLASRLLQEIYKSATLIFASIILVGLGGFIFILDHTFSLIFITSLIVPLILIMIGLGIMFSLLITGALSPFSKITGTASAFLGFLQMVGSSLVAIFASVLKLDSALSLGFLVFILAIIMLLIFFKFLKNPKTIKN